MRVGLVHGLSWIGLAAPTTPWLRATDGFADKEVVLTGRKLITYVYAVDLHLQHNIYGNKRRGSNLLSAIIPQWAIGCEVLSTREGQAKLMREIPRIINNEISYVCIRINSLRNMNSGRDFIAEPIIMPKVDI
ncbi:hypothetical protein TIFTF001_023263 [Ficus carica]|uniref:Uncharacterized protein n=1 Tax=Ficus carica TaxID=3494 RepID=A0AA88AEC4_FICCA|nr:hypothetical protein TIFTF001_023263 [Ficus carica]